MTGTPRDLRFTVGSLRCATPVCPAFAEAPARRTRLWQAGPRAGTVTMKWGGSYL